MNRNVQITAAILRKDMLQLWPFAVLTAALLFLRNLLSVEVPWQSPSSLRQLLEFAAMLACGTLVVVTMQQDSVASERHDWLTRPIPRGSALLAKAIFLFMTIAVPAMVSTLILTLSLSWSLGESVLASTNFSLVWVVPIIVLVATASITSTLLQAAATVFTAILVAAVVTPLATQLSGYPLYLTGSGWIPETFYVFVTLVASIAVLWLQYARRSTTLSRRIFAAGLVLLAVSPVLFPWRAVFAIQTSLSPDPAAARNLSLALEPGCFANTSVDPSSRDLFSSLMRLVPPDEKTTRLGWKTGGFSLTEPRTKLAGSNAIAFSTHLVPAVPAGWRLSLGKVTAAYANARGETLPRPISVPLTPGTFERPDGTTLYAHFWILSRADYDALPTQAVELRLNYSLSLLEPVASATLDADGTRRELEGLGYCSAKPDAERGMMVVDCFKRGPQPSFVTATLVGNPIAQDTGGNYPDYTPAPLQILRAKHRVLRVPLANTASTGRQVTLTAFKARVHMEKQITSPGVLGGPECKPIR